ncbi:MAG TPA: pyridoxamine 5'-phosphate oxidase family protein [Candidatus Eisenbacteria bacterium]|nr:pyridoxamine 5'-phosphate oxidase family protein [Candidatus Eisenbacteria bacterium]
MPDTIMQSIEKARNFLHRVRNASMATVNEDGTPHNTPFFLLYNPSFTKIIWGSHPQSQHSKNLLRTGQAFLAIYDSSGKDGFYVQAAHGHILEGEELDTALKIHNEFRAKEKKAPLEKSYYMGESPQRMWSLDVEKIWVLVDERDEKGLIIQEHRREITPEEFIG